MDHIAYSARALRDILVPDEYIEAASKVRVAPLFEGSTPGLDGVGDLWMVATTRRLLFCDYGRFRRSARIAYEWQRSGIRFEVDELDVIVTFADGLGLRLSWLDGDLAAAWLTLNPVAAV